VTGLRWRRKGVATEGTPREKAEAWVVIGGDLVEREKGEDLLWLPDCVRRKNQTK